MKVVLFLNSYSLHTLFHLKEFHMFMSILICSFLFQQFIRRCLQYRKEDRIDVFSLSSEDYLKPNYPKHSRQSNAEKS